MTDAFFEGVHHIQTDGDMLPEAFKPTYIGVCRCFRGTRGLVRKTPGICSLEDVRYLFGNYGNIMDDLPQTGRALVATMRKGQFWPAAAQDFEATIGAALMVRDDHMKLLARCTEVLARLLAAKDTGGLSNAFFCFDSIRDVAGNFTRKIPEWKGMLQDGALDEVSGSLARVVEESVSLISTYNGADRSAEILDVLATLQTGIKHLTDSTDSIDVMDLSQQVTDHRSKWQQADSQSQLANHISSMKTSPNLDVLVNLDTCLKRHVGNMNSDGSGSGTACFPDVLLQIARWLTDMGNAVGDGIWSNGRTFEAAASIFHTVVHAVPSSPQWHHIWSAALGAFAQVSYHVGLLPLLSIGDAAVPEQSTVASLSRAVIFVEDEGLVCADGV